MRVSVLVDESEKWHFYKIRSETVIRQSICYVLFILVRFFVILHSLGINKVITFRHGIVLLVLVRCALLCTHQSRAARYSSVCLLRHLLGTRSDQG